MPLGADMPPQRSCISYAGSSRPCESSALKNITPSRPIATGNSTHDGALAIVGFLGSKRLINCGVIGFGFGSYLYARSEACVGKVPVFCPIGKSFPARWRIPSWLEMAKFAFGQNTSPETLGFSLGFHVEP